MKFVKSVQECKKKYACYHWKEEYNIFRRVAVENVRDEKYWKSFKKYCYYIVSFCNFVKENYVNYGI